MLEFDFGAAVREVKKRKAKLVAIQLPDGLKQRTAEIAKKVEAETGARAFVFAEPCFGACDIAEQRAEGLGADLVLHLGHSRMLKTKKTIYIPLGYAISDSEAGAVSKKISKELGKKKFKKPALCATIQYTDAMRKIAALLRAVGIGVLVGRGNSEISEAGQVLGCNYSSARSAVGRGADCVVFIGDGMFHALGVSYATGKKVLLANPLDESVHWLAESEREHFIRKRFAAVAAAKNAKVFGIVVSTKPGQERLKLAEALKGAAEKKGLEALIIAADIIRPEHFLGIGIGCLVSTACPRIAADDAGVFGIPVISAQEFEFVVGMRKSMQS